MPLHKAHVDLPEMFVEVERMLARTDDAVGCSMARILKSIAGMSQARGQNAQHQEQLDQFRRRALPIGS